MCKVGIVKYFCKTCPPLSVQDLPMTDDEAHALNVQMRYDEEAKGIVSNIDPEMRKYFVDMKKRINEDKKEQQ